MNDRVPPSKVTILWCPDCGRDDRYQPFTGKSHWTAAKKCPGAPVRVAYVFRCIVPAAPESPAVLSTEVPDA